MSMGSLQFHSKQWIWDGACYPQLFGLGGIMITVAILGLSTTYFGGIGAPAIPYYFWPDLGTLYKRGKSRKRPVRVYMDGCFDLMHYGHANALRQAKALGDELVVGVVSDEEIVANKGPPVLSMEERLTLVSGLKWVDEVITNAPYEINEKFMNILFNDYKIDYIIHGDDPCLLPDGTDAYALAKKVGRYKQIMRTEGVSSTDIVGRILSLRSTKLENGTVNASSHEQLQNGENTPVGGSVKSHLSNFLPTSRRIVQFSNGKLVRRVQSQEGDAAGKEVSATPKKIFQIVHQTIEALLSIPSPELALRLYLQSAEAANDCDLEPVAYEFFTQAFILYEEEVADSKAQVTSLHLIIGTLQRMNIFGVENRDTLTHKATGYSAKLLRKADQCRAVYACSHLFWVDDHDGIKDGERVLLCLKRALRIANAAEQMASATKGGGELATLFIEILNKYLYFFEKGNPQITSSDIQGLIELVTTERHNENSPCDPAADAFFASTVQYINFQKQKGGAISERYEPVVV